MANNPPHSSSFLLLFLNLLTLIFGQVITNSVQETARSSPVKQVYLNETDFIASSTPNKYPSSAHIISLGSGANHQSLKLHVDWTIPANTTFKRIITIQTVPPSPLIVVVYHLNLTVKGATTVQINPLDEGSNRPAAETIRTLTLIPNNNMSCGKKKGSCFNGNMCPTPHYSNLNSFASELNITINQKTGSTTATDHIEFCFVVTPFSPASGTNLNCPFHLFNCGNGRCVDPSLVEDGINQCGNNYDEVPVSQYNWDSWTTGAKVGTLVYIFCFYGLLAALAWITCLKGIIGGCRMTESPTPRSIGGSVHGKNNTTSVIHQGNDYEVRRNSNKLRVEINQLDHDDQEMKEMASGTISTISGAVINDGSSSSAPVVQTGGPTRGGVLRSSLRNKNLDPKSKAHSKKGEVNVAFSADP